MKLTPSQAIKFAKSNPWWPRALKAFASEADAEAFVVAIGTAESGLNTTEPFTPSSRAAGAFQMMPTTIRLLQKAYNLEPHQLGDSSEAISSQFSYLLTHLIEAHKLAKTVAPRIKDPQALALINNSPFPYYSLLYFIIAQGTRGTVADPGHFKTHPVFLNVMTRMVGKPGMVRIQGTGPSHPSPAPEYSRPDPDVFIPAPPDPDMTKRDTYTKRYSLLSHRILNTIGGIDDPD